MDRFGPTGKFKKKKLVHLWGGPLFPVGPVRNLVEWMAPTETFEIRASGSAIRKQKFRGFQNPNFLTWGENRGIVTCSHGTRVLTWKIEGKNSKTLEWKLHLNVGFLRSEAWFSGGPIYIYREKRQEKVGVDNVKLDEALNWGRVGWGCGRGPGKLCVPLEKFWLCPCQPFVWLPPYKHYRTLKLLITWLTWDFEPVV